MTVDELIIELGKLRMQGHGSKTICIEEDDTYYEIKKICAEAFEENNSICVDFYLND